MCQWGSGGAAPWDFCRWIGTGSRVRADCTAQAMECSVDGCSLSSSSSLKESKFGRNDAYSASGIPSGESGGDMRGTDRRK